MLWEVDIYPAEGLPNRLAAQVAGDAADLGLAADLDVTAAYGYLIQGEISGDDVRRIAAGLLADRVVERTVAAPVGDPRLSEPPTPRTPHAPREDARHAERDEYGPCLIHVLPKPGVMDPVAQSVVAAIADFGLRAEAVRTLKKYWVASLSEERLALLCSKILANDAIEQVIVGPLGFAHLEVGSPYEFKLESVPIRGMDDAELQRLSQTGQLFLSLIEMQTIRDYFRKLDRDPTDVELESLAQTWSEHCSHKTLAGRIHYRDGAGERLFENMLRETIFAATQEIRRAAGADDWCVSVFEDNAGVVRFDDRYNVVFKVETHNHPSALEPYGGANTGIGGVIRDPMGTGLGAKPVCNTDVFCFAPPDTPADRLPPGVLHPRRVMKGVVSGVRDYGNRMGIPTVNGAVYFDPRYLGNPLVYCGNVGLIPRDKSRKEPRPGDLVVSIGGRTGRDGIHGATFSSAELTSQSESLSGGAVQIGNAITEKMVLDVLLAARDRGLYHAVTDCGAGGLSSAVGEMGEKIGAEVWLDRVPLKYEGLSYTEIWISEAQERMVLAVAEDRWPELLALCESEGVEATVVGRFPPTGRLVLKYRDQQVADLDMRFLHDGRPPVVREAVAVTPPVRPLREKGDSPHLPRPTFGRCPPSGCFAQMGTVPVFLPARASDDYTGDLLAILGSLNVASKHWVIRQYDHEVQGGSVIKPLVGLANDGPSDAAVIRPVLESRHGLVIACGMNPYYGDLDTYWMAASAIDEAVRNCVAVGADPARVAILDNFCWGNTDRPETLGSLVRAALACYDVATVLCTPFISGKDSLNNEFRPVVAAQCTPHAPREGLCTPHAPPEGLCTPHAPREDQRHAERDEYDAGGAPQPIAIPPSLLISALGQMDDVRRSVSMDLKEPGNYLYLVGKTNNELGGSHFALVHGLSGGEVPKVDAAVAKATFAAIHRAIDAGLVRACHDLSEGGLAVAAAEMAFAGGLGARLSLDAVPAGDHARATATLLFSESNTRFLCEVRPADAAAFEQASAGVPHARVGEVTDDRRFEIRHDTTVVGAEIDRLKRAWQEPLDW